MAKQAKKTQKPRAKVVPKAQAPLIKFSFPAEGVTIEAKDKKEALKKLAEITN